ncbi:MAG: hypothetical protein KC496_21160, partial [Anaerolineae bacterium]|nr:hypothetical protein [Anaerolineae bacterium]
MNHRITVMPDLPVLLVEFEEGFGTSEDIEAYVETLQEAYDNLDKKVYNITDTRSLQLSFDKVMEFL